MIETNPRTRRTPIHRSLLLVWLLGVGCVGEAAVLTAETDGAGSTRTNSNIAAKADGLDGSALPADFPLPQDLAVIFPLFTEGGIRAATPTESGEAMLPERWLDAVSEAYADTVVEDAIEQENRYEDWRIVSVRFAPCGPLGTHFGQAPEALCWPQVRLVWQPILQDLMVLWVRPFFGDDRAIHALYHVMPASGDGVETLEAVRTHLSGGGDRETLPPELLERFLTQRDAALSRWLRLVSGLREAGTAPEATLGIRTELNTSDETVSGPFTERLTAALAATALPERLFELTSFSLPEGRDAAQIDLWAFIAFEGHKGELEQRPIRVHSAYDGDIIGDAGMDETVTMTGGDQELSSWRQEGALAEELTAAVIFSQADKALLGDVINDPRQTMVANTSCSSCHRFNELRFDFHALSHLEDNEASIAPRVVNDVAHDTAWLRAALGR